MKGLPKWYYVLHAFLCLSVFAQVFCNVGVTFAKSRGDVRDVVPFEQGAFKFSYYEVYAQRISEPRPVQLVEDEQPKPEEVVQQPEETPVAPPPAPLKKPNKPKPPAPKEPEPTPSLEPVRDSVTYKATAYTIGKGQVPNLKGITASGTKVKEGRTIAVDPRIIPLGSLVHIESDYPGITGNYIAEDTGSAIKGKKIDVFMGWGGKGTDAYEDAMDFGRREIEVTVIREGYADEEKRYAN